MKRSARDGLREWIRQQTADFTMKQAIEAYVAAGSKCPEPGGQHRADLANDVLEKMCRRVKDGPKGGKYSTASVWRYDAQHEELERIKDAEYKAQEPTRWAARYKPPSLWDEV